MPRADRILQLLQILRRHRRPVTAVALAGDMGVSVRTVYRDMAALVADGVPVAGEAGVGYQLRPGFDLPPLMFTADEIEALMVGMSWVEARADSGLAAAARDVVAKVGAVLPKDLRPLLVDRAVAVPAFGGAQSSKETINVALLRSAIRDQRVVAIDYCDEAGRRTRRSLWPLAIGYFELARILLGWCELRRSFRHFRTDRIVALRVEERRYQGSRAKLMQAWREEERVRCEGRADPDGRRYETRTPNGIPRAGKA